MNTITVEELKTRLDAGENIHLLDVREDDERTEFNIGGTHLSLGKIQTFMLDDIDDWKEEEIVIYCRKGNRSGVAGLFLEQVGYKNTVNLAGGMNAWREKFEK
ncbi:MAG: rhodanese-like domain-containing protein [Chitinophagaceae bacterium]